MGEMVEADDLALAQALSAAVKARGVKMTDLAGQIGTPYRSMQNYLYGRNRIPAAVFVRICAAVDIDCQSIAQVVVGARDVPVEIDHGTIAVADVISMVGRLVREMQRSAKTGAA